MGFFFIFCWLSLVRCICKRFFCAYYLARAYTFGINEAKIIKEMKELKGQQQFVMTISTVGALLPISEPRRKYHAATKAHSAKRFELFERFLANAK